MNTSIQWSGLSFFVGIFFLFQFSAQAQVFTWKKGGDGTLANGTYGVQSVPSAANTPGARDLAVGWTDLSGNLWLFGGSGYGATGGSGRLNDLWKYDVNANMWIWVNGSNVINQSGNYGTKGVSALSNSPGGRNQAQTWTDSIGNLWMFGGSGYDAAGTLGYLNDMWKYDISSNTWTWVHGSNAANGLGVYGVQGTPAAVNTPGSRRVAVGWTDDEGHLWMFSGDGYAASGGAGYLNDLWKYNIATNEWTWVKGSDLINELGVYGILGTPNPANNPGGRYAAAAWKDAAGNFWMFNGNGFPLSGASGRMNDLWKYNRATNEWTWMKGNSLINLPGNYGTKGTASVSNIPGARYVSAVFTNGTNNMWMFGGLGYAATSTQGRMNDLWSYSASSNMWTWQQGQDVINGSGVYGTQNVASPANIPGGRNGAVYWSDNNGKLWIFGGAGYSATGVYGALNDLWSVSCIIPPQNVSTTQSICNGGKATLNVAGSGAFSWYNAATGGTYQGSGLSFTTPPLVLSTVYYVQDSVCGNNGPRTSVTVMVDNPIDVSVNKNGGNLSANNTSASSYQWLDCDKGKSPISGETSVNFSPTANGVYAVAIVAGGCSDTSDCVAVTNVGINRKTESQALMIYPNPTSGMITISSLEDGSFTLVNQLGAVVRSFLLNVSNNRQLKMNGLDSGIYILSGTTGNDFVNERIVILGK